MAKKGIILSNGDGRVTWTNTASVSIDDGTGGSVANNISASFISASSLVLTGISAATTRILSASNGTFSTFGTGTAATDGGSIVYNGTSWVATNIKSYDYSGSVGGDLSGSYGYESDVKVTNIGNVSSGTLPVNFGGTGASLTKANNFVMDVSRSAGGTPTFSTISVNSGSMLVTSDNKWQSLKPSYVPDVRYYLSGSTGNTFTWNRPINAKFARVILQGAGGGGGGGGSNQGGGGGSGGLTDIILDVSSIQTASVTVGLGGAGGAISGNGSTGGSSIFSAYSASGGGGGIGGTRTGGSGGIGITKNGGAGGGASGATVYDMPSGGAGGGGNPGTIIQTLSGSYKNFGYSIATDGIAVVINNVSGSSASANQPANGSGAGGGGGLTNIAGGRGGNGYALIISW